MILSVAILLRMRTLDAKLHYAHNVKPKFQKKTLQKELPF